MWFKNLMTYRLTKPLDWDLAQLQTQLEDCQFHPCGAQGQSKFGWSDPLRGTDLLY
ncbi:recombination-associated protein RdgC, partial [Pseudomonas aeruginosa]